MQSKQNPQLAWDMPHTQWQLRQEKISIAGLVWILRTTDTLHTTDTIRFQYSQRVLVVTPQSVQECNKDAENDENLC